MTHRSVSARLRIMLLAIAVAAIVFATVSSALAYDETQPIVEGHYKAECVECHPDDVYVANDCYTCHGGFPGDTYKIFGKGPHTAFLTTTTHCRRCHSVHSAPAQSVALLPRATISDTCSTCHDSTGGQGVYGALAVRGVAVGGGHRVEPNGSVIPGADSVTGGSLPLDPALPGRALTCDDCHNPHNADCVNEFQGERRRTIYKGGQLGYRIVTTNRMLKRKVGRASQPVNDYGSDWCLGCHGGRASGGGVMNHPVDSKVSIATPYIYERTAVLASQLPTSATFLGSMGGAHNRGFLMPFPRSPQQAGHAPICQQCHEDSRDPGTIVDGLADELSTSVSLDGFLVNGNPRFQNFPHETVNPTMTVEVGDGLCDNCHEPARLP